MPRRLLKYKNYDIHAITTATADGRRNANVVAWVMQTSMDGKTLAVALYKPDYTIELVRASGLLNVNLLATEQRSLIRRLGQRSGRTVDKFRRLPHALDERGIPYLTEAVGYAQCNVVACTGAGDHELFICHVVKQTVLHPGKTVMTYQFLRDNKLVRG